MKKKKSALLKQRYILAIILLFFLTCCGKNVTLFHINDTHSYLFGSEVNCKYKGENHNFKIGGLDLILHSLEETRKKEKNIMFLHAGDLIQGTRYFKEFQGVADVEIMNYAKLDAFVLGNHEFDKGEVFLSELLKKAAFPVIAANIDFKKESLLKETVKPYIITGSWPFRNGIIGVITPLTSSVSSPGKNLEFTDPAKAVDRYIKELKNRSVTRIFVLSHLGLEEDIKLAQSVEGIDVIVGGHSHSMLGFTGIEGLKTKGDYPIVTKDPAGRDVLIVQAWDHARAFGVLNLNFNMSGEIASYNGKTIYPIRKGTKIPFRMMLSPFNEFVFVEPAEEIVQKFDSYQNSISKKYSKEIGYALETLEHFWEKGSDVAPLVAEAIIWKMERENREVDIAIQNAGGVRKTIAKGKITVGEVADTLPFFNNIIILKIKGDKLLEALSESINNVLDGEHLGSFPYLAGMEFGIEKGEVKNFKIVKNGEKSEVDPEKTYVLATDSYIGNGGNGYEIFKQISDKETTPYIVSETFAEYIQNKKELAKPSKKHIAIQ
ncbi:MAG: bifunctional metallophosphatase/5'-nucleotidase [bacterium]